MGAPIKINHLTFWLARVMVITFDKLNSLSVTLRTASEIWRMQSDISARVIHNKFITAGCAMIASNLWAGKRNALCLV